MKFTPEHHRLVESQIKSKGFFTVEGTKKEIEIMLDNMRGDHFKHSTSLPWKYHQYGENEMLRTYMYPFKEKRGKKGLLRGWKVGKITDPKNGWLVQSKEVTSVSHVLEILGMKKASIELVSTNLGIL